MSHCNQYILHFRHPDITYSAYNVFTMIGSALSLEVLSYYVDFVVFWPLFLLCFTVVLVCFSINTYYNGMYSMFRDDNETDNKVLICGLFCS